VPLGAGTEVRLRARSAAAEQDAVGWIHRGNMLTAMSVHRLRVLLRTIRTAHLDRPVVAVA
jgi:hypothetical protein